MEDAYDIMIEWEDVFIGNMGSNVLKLLQKMDADDYSYIPIVDHKELVGCLYRKTILPIAYRNPEYKALAELCIEDVLRFLDFNEIGVADTIGFVTPDTSREELLQIFSPGNDQVLEILFVTDNGKQYGKPLGIITPWDLLQKETENN